MRSLLRTPIVHIALALGLLLGGMTLATPGAHQADAASWGSTPHVASTIAP